MSSSSLMQTDKLRIMHIYDFWVVSSKFVLSLTAYILVQTCIGEYRPIGVYNAYNL